MEDYEYLANLGEGAYGFVWKCEERATGRLVAIKGIKQAHEEPEIMRIAVREVRVLQTLKHPAIIPLLEAFKSKSGRVYMVFPYVGRSAYQELDEHPDGLPNQQLKLLLWQLLQALVYLHRRKVVHRDIKPGNILLSEGGEVRLCDFGFARTTHCGPRDVENLTSYVVTRWYRAPELLVGDRYGPSCDIWSLGCTVAELATGQPLFPGKSTGEQLWRVMRCFGPLTASHLVHMACDPRLVRVRVPVRGRTLRDRLLGCDPDLFRLVESCLRLDPSDRPTAGELLQSPYFWGIPKLLAGTPLEQVYSGLLQQQEERRQRQHHKQQDQNWKEDERRLQQAQEPSRTEQRQMQPSPLPKQQQQRMQQQQESRNQQDYMTGMAATGPVSRAPRACEGTARDVKQEKVEMPGKVVQPQQLEEEGENEEIGGRELSTTSSLIPMMPGDLGARDVQEVAISTKETEDVTAEVDAAELAAEAMEGEGPQGQVVPQAQELSTQQQRQQQRRMLHMESASGGLRGVLRTLRTVDTLVPERFVSNGSVTEEQLGQDTVQSTVAAAGAFTRDTAAVAVPIHQRSEWADGPRAGGGEGTFRPLMAAGGAPALAVSPPNPPTPTPPRPPTLQQYRRRGSDYMDAVSTAAAAAAGSGVQVSNPNTTQAAAMTSGDTATSCMRAPYSVGPVELASYGDITLPSSLLSSSAVLGAANTGSMPLPTGRQSSIFRTQYDLTAASTRRADDVAPYSAIKPCFGPPAPNPCRNSTYADADGLCNNLPGNPAVAAAAAAGGSNFRSSCTPLHTSKGGDVTDFDLSTAISVYPYGCTDEGGLLLLQVSENGSGSTRQVDATVKPDFSQRSTNLLLAQLQDAGAEPASSGLGQASPSALLSPSVELDATASMQRLLRPSRSARSRPPPPPPSQPPAILMMSMDSSLKPWKLPQSMVAGGGSVLRKLPSAQLGSVSGVRGPYQDATAAAVTATQQRSVGGSFSRAGMNAWLELEDTGETANSHYSGTAASTISVTAGMAAAAAPAGRVSSFRRAGTASGRLLGADDPAQLLFSGEAFSAAAAPTVASGAGVGGTSSRPGGVRTMMGGQSPKIAPAPTAPASASMAWAATPSAAAPASVVQASSPSAVPAGHASRSRFMMTTTASSLSHGWLSRDVSGSPLPAMARIAKASPFVDAPVGTVPLQPPLRVLMTLSPHPPSASASLQQERHASLEGPISAVAAIADGRTYNNCSKAGPERLTVRPYARRTSRTVSGHEASTAVEGSVAGDSATGSFDDRQKGGPLMRFFGVFKKAFVVTAGTTAKHSR